MTDVLRSDTATQWIRHWLYDWGGANMDLFLSLHRALPDSWVCLPEVSSALGSYWGAPVIMVLVLIWRRLQVRPRERRFSTREEVNESALPEGPVVLTRDLGSCS